MEALAETLETLVADAECRVVTIRGSGESFCTGREVKAPSSGTRPSAFALRASLARISRVNDALRALPAVTIAAVNGDALGFGCGLAVQCDLTVAVEDAQLGFPEIDSGLAPTIVMSYLPRYVPRKRAAELVLTGQKVPAREAAALGLVSRVVARGELDREVQTLVETLLAKDALALRTAKLFLAETQDMTVEQASRYGLNVLPGDALG